MCVVCEYVCLCPSVCELTLRADISEALSCLYEAQDLKGAEAYRMADAALGIFRVRNYHGDTQTLTTITRQTQTQTQQAHTDSRARGSQTQAQTCTQAQSQRPLPRTHTDGT